MDQRIKLRTLQLIQPPEVGHYALAHACVGAEALDDLQIAPAAGARNARVHVPTVARA